MEKDGGHSEIDYSISFIAMILFTEMPLILA